MAVPRVLVSWLVPGMAAIILFGSLWISMSGAFETKSFYGETLKGCLHKHLQGVDRIEAFPYRSALPQPSGFEKLYSASIDSQGCFEVRLIEETGSRGSLPDRPETKSVELHLFKKDLMTTSFVKPITGYAEVDDGTREFILRVDESDL